MATASAYVERVQDIQANRFTRESNSSGYPAPFRDAQRKHFTLQAPPGFARSTRSFITHNKLPDQTLGPQPRLRARLIGFRSLACCAYIAWRARPGGHRIQTQTP